MALTRPRLGQINTTVSNFTDPIVVFNAGSTQANVDQGILFNRANGLVSNVALFFSESANSFVLGFTSNSGQTNSNVQISGNANLQVNDVHASKIYTAEGLYWAGNGNVIVTGDGGGGVFTASNTAPVTPNESDFWYKISDDILLQYISDGTSSYWVDVQSPTLFANTAGVLTSLGETTITGNLIPSANITYNLGSTNYRFKDLFLSGTTIDLGGATIKTDSGSGAIALIPQPTIGNPNPTGVVITPAGTLTSVITVGGVVSENAIGNVSNTATISATTNFGNIIANGNITIESTTTSTSTTTGALVVSGGLGVAGNVTANRLTTTTGIFWSNGSVVSSGGTNTATVNALIWAQKIFWG